MKANALYCNLPVYETCYRLTLLFAGARDRLPRSARYTLGQDVQNALIETLTLIYRANASRDKVRLIMEARQRTVQIQIYLRLLSDLHHISERQFTEFFELTVSASKQFTAWQRSQQTIFNDAGSPSFPGGRPECGGSRSAAARRKVNPMTNEGGLTAETEVIP